MARKDLLKDLMAPLPSEQKDEPAPRLDAARPRSSKGAIGAVSKSIADLKSRSIVEVDPFLIEAGGVKDRLEHDEVEHASLMASLREYGQQVPVLLRPHPERDGRFQIVYGRRRVQALRDLGRTVKALVQDIDDRSLVIAQGQENTARRDLSFIEKANFARQMVEMGYERKIICDALSIDKTVISRMLAVTDRVPLALIEKIGAAPGIGRDRWLALAELYGRSATDDPAFAPPALSDAPSSDERFEAMLAWLSDRISDARSGPPPPAEQVRTAALQDANGKRLAEVTRGPGTVTIKMKARDAGGFEEWLADNLAEIHRDWLSGRGD